MKTIIVTGSYGLIGSEVCRFYDKLGFRIVGIDNDMRKYFFGESSKERSDNNFDNYIHHGIDIRDYSDLSKLFSTHSSDISLIVHTAAQPSHDWAAKEPITDFTVNALGTLNLLECTRLFCPDATFIFTDPRYWTWLFEIEREIRNEIPLMYLNIWDDYPAPLYNKPYYESCDLLMAISKQTKNINEIVLGEAAKDKLLKYVPHGINHEHFFPMTSVEDIKNLDQFKKDLFQGWMPQ